MAAARAYGAVLEPYSRGVYVNVLGDEGEAGVRRAYPAGKLAQLANGFIYGEDGGANEIHNAKRDWLRDLIEEAT